MIQSNDGRLQGIGQVLPVQSSLVKHLFLDPAASRMLVDDRCSPHAAIASQFARSYDLVKC
jgi:hypothetical protein